jgi:ABC-type sugar transport system substrate-binding protein
MLLFAGGKQESSSGAINIGLALDNMDDPYWVGLRGGMDKAIAELGDKVIVDAQICQFDATLQAKQIQDMIAAGANAIVCVYVDKEAIKQSVKLCNDKNIPFVYADIPVESSPGAKVSWGISTDEFTLSKTGMEWLVDYGKKKGITQLKVLELAGSLANANVLNRTRGFEDVMSRNSSYLTRVQTVPTEWNMEKTLAGVTNALQANPDINCIFMHGDVLLSSTIQALEAAGRWKKIGDPGKIIVLPYGGNSLALKSINDGYVEMCFGMNTVNIGYQAVMAAYNLAIGKVADYAKVVADPGFLITPDNFAETAPKTFGYSGFKSGK